MVPINDMNTVVDDYKLHEMTDNTEAITATCLRAAEARVLSYLSTKYDVVAIQKLPTDAPALADIKEIIKDIALYYIMRRHNVDMAYSRVVDAYKQHNEYLKGIATGNIGIVGLPLIKGKDGKVVSHIAMGSRPKTDFEY